MRRHWALAVLVILFLSLATPAHAQGFWRWFEKLSGPTLDGLGVEVTFLCPPEPDDARAGSRTPRFDLGCRSVSRTARNWLSAGTQVYLLKGDNNLTAEPNDRVDAFGVMPFVTFHTIPGLDVSAGLAFRRYSTPAGHIFQTPVEVWANARPGRLTNSQPSSQPSFRDDFLNLRVGLVLNPGFDAGDFGPGTEELPTELSMYFGVLLDFSAIVR